MPVTFIYLFIFSLVFLLVVRKIAPLIGLIDKPNYRKRHKGTIPLVGGIAIYAGICFYFILNWYQFDQPAIYLICSGILVFVGVLDDRFDIPVRYRGPIQIGVAFIMMFVADLYLHSLGFIVGPWELILGPIGYIVTIFAVVGAINAFNMVDGIDGLLGGLSSVTFGSMAVLLYIDGQPALAQWCLAIIVVTIPYILLNMGLLGSNYKVFMGDAGSTLVGFTVVWILLESTQGTGHPMNPVTALWVIAIPLMDMAAIMYRRHRKGVSVFTPDRQHIHHILMRSGFSSRQTFVLITTAATIIAFVGVLGEKMTFMSEWGMLLLFFAMFFIYGYCLKNAWRVARYFRRRARRQKCIK